MLKSKMMLGAIALLMVLALAPTGYAQLSISAFNTPSPSETATSKTAQVSDPTTNVGLTVTGTVLSEAPITGGRLRIQFPSAVTNACIATSVDIAGTNDVPAAGSANAANGNTGVKAVSGGVVGTSGNTPVCHQNVDFPSVDMVRVTTASGVFARARVASVNGPLGRVDIDLPCSSNSGGTLNFTGPNGAGTITNATGTFILQGVRIDASALTAFPATATLALSNAGGDSGCNTTNTSQANVFVNTSSVNVITSGPAGLASVASGAFPSSSTSGTTTLGVSSNCPGTDDLHADCGVATINTNRNVPKSNATFTVTEGHAYAWYHFDNSFTQFPGAAGFVNDASFQLTFANVPAGVTLNLAVAAYRTSTSAPVLSSTSITTAQNTSIVTWGGNLSTSNVDRVVFRITGVTVPTSGTIAAGTITVSARMYPVGDAYDLSSPAPTVITGSFPRFSDVSVGNLTVVNIVPANTTLMIPFAVSLAAARIDTGIAIANTSTDPFGASGGGATPQSGTVRFDFFATSNTGVASTANFTTSTTKNPGGGLAADGTLAAGATMAVNLSSLLTLAGITGDFSGYIFIQANFLPAHGAAFVYNPVSGGFAAYGAVPVFVLPPPSTSSRLASGVEALHF